MLTVIIILVLFQFISVWSGVNLLIHIFTLFYLNFIIESTSFISAVPTIHILANYFR
jgi:hypothetical protein